MKTDILNKDDIKLLVDKFYDKVKTNELLGNVFDNVMQINWEKHLPKMYDFWEYILFHKGNYNGRPFPPHLNVNEKVTLTDNHFGNWITLFDYTVDENFEGKNATLIKIKARNIKEIWNHKFNHINHGNMEEVA